MATIDKQPRVSIEETNRRLRNLEHELRERKSARLSRSLEEAAAMLTVRFAGHPGTTVESGDRMVIVRQGDDREVRLYFRLRFDEKDLMTATFRVQDRQIRRRPDYEQIETTRTFQTLNEAAQFVVHSLG
jgi:hypothetical protein